MRTFEMKTPAFECKVNEVRLLTSSICSLSFDSNKPLEFQAGQYINVELPNPTSHDAMFSRNYSLATPPHKRPIELCFELVGFGSNYLSKLAPNDTFMARGPLGKFVCEATSE